MTTSAQKKWLAVVGIGEDGVAGLAPASRDAIAAADFVFGGDRHLRLASSLIKGTATPWPSPFSIEPVLARKDRTVCVLASGDPFLFGVGATLARHVAVEEMYVLPAPSAFSLAASRLGWPLQDVDTISVHGRPLDLVRPLLQPGRRILALTSDGDGPAALAALLTSCGFGPSPLTVLEALGGPNERRRTVSAQGFDVTAIDPLNMVAIEVVPDARPRILPLGSGLPDGLFETDGQLTKREVRAVTLSSLAPRRGELLWDIGAGSGSIGIEWMLAHPSMRTIAVEADRTRADRMRCNAATFGVPGLRVVEGIAPAALAGLESPDAIFIGGGGSDEGVIDTAIESLKPGGRLVANAVTLEMEAILLAHRARLGGELTRIAVSRAKAVGSMSGWKPAMPVTQWVWNKPDGGRP